MTGFVLRRAKERLATLIGRPLEVGAVISTVLLVAIGFLPLFGGPGYEHALATGLIVPSAAAIAAAVDAGKGRSASPLASVARGIGAGLVMALLSLASALVHGVRVGICDLWGALPYYGLTAGLGAMLGGAWGGVVGELVRTAKARGRLRRVRLAAVTLALAGPIVCVVVSVARFVASPMIFAFDPFVGYFSGTLYDTVIDAGTTLLTYRAGTVATLAATTLLASIFVRADDRRFGLALDLSSANARARAALGLVAMVASVALLASGEKLGYWSTPESIAKDLGAEKHGVRCDVVYPSATREQDANLLVKDCDEEVFAVEKRLGIVPAIPRIRAFMFRDENDKKRLMGAAHTFIAKPWRKEVYLQLHGYPHPVIGHELAHVIAGAIGPGPFHIAGAAGGWIPNPGLIEGIAVFASPDDEDLTDTQWARAMMEIGILPSMQRVFSFGFLGDASAKSYTLAGAFMTWIGEQFTVDVIRRWYAGGDIHVLTGLSWPELDAGFRTYLATIPLPSEAQSFAKAKFSRPGIFGRRCPHVVDAIRHEADSCRETQRFEEAIALYESALAKDPSDQGSTFGRALTVRRRGRVRGAIEDAELVAIANGESVPRIWRDRAEEALADADFVDGRFEEAARRYEGLAARSVDEDSARTLEVKKLACFDEQARAGVGALLLGDANHPPDFFVAGVALGAITEGERSALAGYLIGRNYVQRGHYEEGRDMLDRAYAKGLPTPRIARETLRQEAIAACALDDKATLAKMRSRIEAPDDPFKGASGGRRDATLRMIDRCAVTP
jgi:tetratricopeptide (TPR) repeat protein